MNELADSMSCSAQGTESQRGVAVEVGNEVDVYVAVGVKVAAVMGIKGNGGVDVIDWIKEVFRLVGVDPNRKPAKASDMTNTPSKIIKGKFLELLFADWAPLFIYHLPNKNEIVTWALVTIPVKNKINKSRLRFKSSFDQLSHGNRIIVKD